jgi:hypothetical protein
MMEPRFDFFEKRLHGEFGYLFACYEAYYRFIYHPSAVPDGRVISRLLWRGIRFCPSWLLADSRQEYWDCFKRREIGDSLGSYSELVIKEINLRYSERGFGFDSGRWPGETYRQWLTMRQQIFGPRESQ